jgi:hypothetical protein
MSMFDNMMALSHVAAGDEILKDTFANYASSTMRWPPTNR